MASGRARGRWLVVGIAVMTTACALVAGLKDRELATDGGSEADSGFDASLDVGHDTATPTDTGADSATDGSAEACTETDNQFCAEKHAQCGSVSGVDKCGQQRTIPNCGDCTAPQYCADGGAGTPVPANTCTGDAGADA